MLTYPCLETNDQNNTAVKIPKLNDESYNLNVVTWNFIMQVNVDILGFME